MLFIYSLSSRPRTRPRERQRRLISTGNTVCAVLDSQKNQNANADPERTVVKNVKQRVFARGRVSETGFTRARRFHGQIYLFPITRYVFYVVRIWKTPFFFGPDVHKFYAYLRNTTIASKRTELHFNGRWKNERLVNVNVRRKGPDREARASHEKLGDR